MNQRYSQDTSRGRQEVRGRQDESFARGRGPRFDREYDEERFGRNTEDMGEWEDARDLGRGERHAAAPDVYYPSGQPMGQPSGQYYGSYPSQQGARYYEGPRAHASAHPRGDFDPVGGAYGPEDFRQGSGQRNHAQGNYASDPGPYGRQGQRYFGNQGGTRSASNPDLGYGYGNFRQQRFQPGTRQGAYAQSQGLSGYGYGNAGRAARDFEDEGDYGMGQSYGGYSPSQGGYGQSWSGYGRGGYGTVGAQDYGPAYEHEMYGTTRSSAGSGFGSGAATGYGSGYSQGLAGGRSGYGQGSGYTGAGYGEGHPSYEYSRHESQFGKGPKGYARSDDRLREDISERLMRDHDIDASDISIDVKNGAVTLTGSVDDRRLKHYVEDTVEACLGVRDIDNRLTVRPRYDGGSTGTSSFASQSAASGTTGSRASTGTTTTGTTGSTGTSGSGSLGGSTGEDGATTRSKN